MNEWKYVKTVDYEGMRMKCEEYRIAAAKVPELEAELQSWVVDYSKLATKYRHLQQDFHSLLYSSK